jgi:hypothetical protein
MATKKSNEAKITIWTDTMRSEMSGSISSIVFETFSYIMPGKTKTAAEMRAMILKLMQDRHEELIKEGR